MTIVVYKCDVCKRDIELEQNIKGLENIQRCTITHGCRGKLYQIKVLADFVRGRLPDQVAGLDDWRNRKVLYNHKQTIERDNWIIEHNLGTFPSISVFIDVPTEADPDNQEEIIPVDTIIVDEDHIILKFDKALSGLAQLVARQSDPNLLRPFVGLNIESKELQQISINGNISIATRTSTIGTPVFLSIKIEYTTTTNAIIIEEYTINDDNDTGTWSDIDKTVIKGKTYGIRSFNPISDFTPPNDFDNESIASGSTLKFISIRVITPAVNNQPIPQDEVYIVFANKPYDNIDKVTTQYIDVFDVAESSNNFTLVYDTGEFFADKEIIQDTYPPIRAVL